MAVQTEPSPSFPQVVKPGNSRDAKSASIVNAAKRVFLTNGFDGASMDEIALAAGVSKRTVYNRYASKEELFDAVATDACRQIFTFEMDACFETPMREFLEMFAATVLTVKLEPEALALQRNVAFQSHRMTAVGRAYMEHAVQPFIKFLAHYFEQQAALGKLRALDGEEAAWMFGSMIREPMETRMLMGGEEPEDFEQAVSEQAKIGVDRFLRIYETPADPAADPQ